MISVIIPLYNKEKTILSTLNSIRNQTLRNWECIVVDDGSSDNSCKIIEELHDERIRLIKKEMVVLRLPETLDYNMPKVSGLYLWMQMTSFLKMHLIFLKT